MTIMKKTSNFNRSLCAIAVSFVLGTASHIVVAADSASSGYVSGTAKTATGESVAGATIVIKNIDTGLERKITTGANGSYRFPLLPTGNYLVTAEKDGFQMARLENVKVSMGNNSQLDLSLSAVGADVERINVVGSRIATVDVTSSEAVMVVDQAMIARIPISRDITSVALMAPGTTQGDRGFGNLASFGGASVGENAYYLNGMNITNFRNGLGGADVPFELYDSFEVKTGGYSAEFGRSTGGVVNATTKRGTNDFKAGASIFWEPDALRGTAKDSLRTDPVAIADAGSKYFVVNSKDKTDEANFNVWASGAAIEDKLFFFVLLNQKNRTSDYAEPSNFYYRDASDLFAAAKIDFYLNENNILELTAFDSSSDLNTSKYNYNVDSDQLKSYRGDYILKRGGATWALKYTSLLTDDLTMALNYGINKADYSNVNAGASPFGDTPMIFDRLSNVNLGTWGLATPSVQEDERKALRLDFDYFLGDHTLRFGVDREEMSAIENTQRTGGVSYRYQAGCDAAALEQEKAVGCTSVRKEVYINKGNFTTESNAYYITDTWQVSDQLTLNLGLRNESFVNYNKADIAFVDIDNQLAPRLGLVFDPTGAGESKFFANYGRYYLPVATNTNIRLAGDELYTRQNFQVLAIDPVTFIPTLGNATSALQTFADGTLKNTKETVNADIDPMYQDEFILGYHGMIDSDWSFGIKGTYRDLKSSLEDVAIDKGFNDMLVRDFGSECTVCDGFHYYVLTNPGKAVTLTTDPDGDGPLQNQAYTISAADLGYPKATRKYTSIDFNINRRWDESWMLDATYTWSHSWGNSEGFVRSDNEQDDAGLTTNFDQPGLTDGAYGNLPNDRRHQVKVFGSYKIMEDLTTGINFRWKSGRPKNAFGYHGSDVYASWYGAESFYKDGVLVPRGSLGTTPSNYTIDLSMQYISTIQGLDITWRADVFNLLNSRKVLEVSEIAERYSSSDEVTEIDIGEADPDYGLATDFQNPRYVRLSVSIEF